MTGTLPRLAVRLHGGLDPRAAAELAAIAERHGYAGLWFPENPFARGVMPAIAAAAVATQRIRLGIGVVNPYSRHPALIAMEAGSLDELSGGRLVLGIGSGVAAGVRRMGLGYERPLSAVREAIDIVRALLRGESVTYAGRVFAVDGARLGFAPPRPDMPIHLAAMGDRAIGLAGEVADGLIVSNLCPEGYTRRAAAILAAAAAKAGRRTPEIVQYVPCVTDRDGAAARIAAKRAVGEMLASLWPAEPWPPLRETIVRVSGIPRAEFAAAVTQLRSGVDAVQVLDERYVAAFAIAGTPEECLELARAYAVAGVAELALSFAGPEPGVGLAALAAARDAQIGSSAR